jgi:3-oxoacyl-[acyl-carrier protein] reductase
VKRNPPPAGRPVGCGTSSVHNKLATGGATGDPVHGLGPTLVFLCSEGSRFITGQLIAVDGGLVMLGA